MTAKLRLCAVLLGCALAFLAHAQTMQVELVIRAERTGVVRVREIPVRVLEKRQPSIHLFRRVPNVLKGVARLVVAIRIKG